MKQLHKVRDVTYELCTFKYQAITFYIKQQFLDLTDMPYLLGIWWSNRN